MGLSIEDANNIKKLRELTGSRLIVCKKAYIESEKNFNDALNLLNTDDRFSGIQRLVYHRPIKNNESGELKMNDNKKCCGEMMVGKCDCCGKERVPLQRTYFKYPGISCTCHSPEHFIIRDHCNDCVPVEPEYSKVEFRTDELKHPASIAMDILAHELGKDKSNGSYYYVWQSNIACAAMDKGVSHELANEIAKSFLDRIITTSKIK